VYEVRDVRVSGGAVYSREDGQRIQEARDVGVP
jgi:hypothetical protein